MPALWPSLLAAGLLLPPAFAAAQTPVPLPPETRLVGITGAPAATEDDFSIAPAQDLVVTLTDLQVPAALSSATVVITQAGSMVGNATLAPPATTATVAVPGANGQYVLRVFGLPNAAYSVGTFTVCVAPKANPSSCIQSASIAGNISVPSAAGNPTVSTLSVNLAVTTAGAYTVTFADDQFPVALNGAPNLALFQGAAPVQLGIPSGTVLNLSAGTYTLLAIAQADQAIQAGLYGITISGPSGVAPALSNTYPVGILGAPQIVQNPSNQTLTLKISDFAFPAALAGASAIATSGGTKLGVASTANASSFPASAGTLQFWSFATAGADAGTYEVDLTSPTAALRQSTSGVNKGNSLAFAFLTPVLPSGSYQENASDFQFPQTLQGLQFAVAQNGSILAKSAAPGSLNFTAAGGPVVLLADATTPANGNGLFDVNVQTSGASPQLVFDKTQGVSASDLFDSQTINLGTSGDFNVTLTDLNFPTPFQDLALVVSNGGAVLGKIFGGGTFPISAAPGAYQLTFIATPAAQQQYGMYAVQIVYAAPTVTLTASPTSVAAGGLTTLSWTTKDATSCTAGGGAWSGNPSTGSGTLAVIVSATTTFTLTCTGPGGTAAQSVVVTATARPGSSGGGGGIDPSLLILLGMIASVRARYRS
jgi:hypothetical protein